MKEFARFLGWRLCAVVVLLLIQGAFLNAALIPSLWVGLPAMVAYTLLVAYLVAWDRFMAYLWPDQEAGDG